MMGWIDNMWGSTLVVIVKGMFWQVAYCTLGIEYDTKQMKCSVPRTAKVFTVTIDHLFSARENNLSSSVQPQQVCGLAENSTLHSTNVRNKNPRARER